MARFKIRIIYSFVLISCSWTISTIYQKFANDKPSICRENFQTQETKYRPICPRGLFGLPGMTECHPLLNCTEIKNDVKVLERIGEGKGKVKKIELATWIKHNVALNILSLENRRRWKRYYLRGVENLRNMQPSTKVTQLLGFCDYSFVTEYHPLGSADNFDQLLRSPAYEKYDNTRTRLSTCISYIEVINFLHNSPMGTRVFCDTCTLERTLRQMLLTVDFNVILNDVEHIPEVKSNGRLFTSCSTRCNNDPFAAPEQRKLLKEQDEKLDVWRIPTVCDYFLGASKAILSDQLKTINSRCKSENATLRPPAAEVSRVYRNVLENIP